MNYVHLTDDEFVVLDGRCTNETQAKVNAAKARVAARGAYGHLTPGVAGLIADAVAEATEHGLLWFANRRIDRCRICKTSAGYAPYKSGPRKGKPNYGRPLTLHGIELADRFVTVQGHITCGGCTDCVNAALPDLREALRGIKVQLPAQLYTDGEPRWVRHRNRQCTSCGWTGHEGEMTRARTLMGDGTYPAGCPSCGTENGFGRSPVDLADGHTIVEATEEDRR